MLRGKLRVSVSSISPPQARDVLKPFTETASEYLAYLESGLPDFYTNRLYKWKDT